MELDHEFTVPVPVDQAWSVLLDVERVALCMPGATLDSADGDEYAGRLKVKLGAMTITYRGTAHITVTDEAGHIVTIEASAKESRGAGTAAATVQAQLHDRGDGTTKVTVHTKLNVTGKPAQFGRNILGEVGGKLVDRFAAALAEELAADQQAATSAKQPQAAAEPETAIADVPRQASATDTETLPQTKAGSETASAETTTDPGTATKPEAAAEPKAAPKSGAATDSDTAAKSEAVTEPETAAEPKAAAGPEAAAPAQAADAAPGEAAAESEAGVKPEAAAPAPGEARGGEDAAGTPSVPKPRAAGTGEAVPAAAPERQRRSEEAIDILEVAGPSVAKRAVPVMGGLAVLLTVRYLFRRRRGRHHR